MYWYHLQDPDVFLIYIDFGNSMYEIVKFSSSHLQPLIKSLVYTMVDIKRCHCC